jgi:hypothetical protein
MELALAWRSLCGIIRSPTGEFGPVKRYGRNRLARYRVTALQIAGLLLLAGCSTSDERTSVQDPRLLALLTDGRLISATSEEVREEVLLTRAGLKPLSRRLIAVTPDGRTVGVLLLRREVAGADVAILSVRGLRARSRAALPIGRGVRALAIVAPAPNRLVVLGERAVGPGHRQPVGWIIDVPSGRLVKRWALPERLTRQADVIDATAASDGIRLYLSYHGGADVIDWKSGASLCGDQGRPRSPCILPFHGEVAATADGVLGTGADDQTLLKASPDGRIVERWHTRLTRNHLMRFTYDPSNKRAYALGSCLYTGGLARIDFALGLRWRRGIGNIGDLGPPTLCGERSAARGRLIALSRGPEFEGERRSHLTFVDAEKGKVHARLSVPAPAVDLVFLEPRGAIADPVGEGR